MKRIFLLFFSLIILFLTIRFILYYPLPFCLSIPPYERKLEHGVWEYYVYESKFRFNCIIKYTISHNTIRPCLFMNNTFADECVQNYVQIKKSPADCQQFFTKDRYTNYYFWSGKYTDYYNKCISESVLQMSNYDMNKDWCNKIIGYDFYKDTCYKNVGILFKNKRLCDMIKKPTTQSEISDYQKNYNDCMTNSIKGTVLK
jgi:hypothetical protein